MNKKTASIMAIYKEFLENASADTKALFKNNLNNLACLFRL